MLMLVFVHKAGDEKKQKLCDETKENPTLQRKPTKWRLSGWPGRKDKALSSY
jgi:hypothetical protein